jgi:hypothetical protein
VKPQGRSRSPFIVAQIKVSRETRPTGVLVVGNWLAPMRTRGRINPNLGRGSASTALDLSKLAEEDRSVQWAPRGRDASGDWTMGPDGSCRCAHVERASRKSAGGPAKGKSAHAAFTFLFLFLLFLFLDLESTFEFKLDCEFHIQSK